MGVPLGVRLVGTRDHGKFAGQLHLQSGWGVPAGVVGLAGAWAPIVLVSGHSGRSATLVFGLLLHRIFKGRF